MRHLLLLVWVCFFITIGARAQNYRAIQGSSYAGALGVHNNPASIVSTPFKWDVALFGVQATSSTNAFTIHNYSFLSSPANSLYQLTSGQFPRKANIDFNLNLLNARISLNRKSSIAFGAVIRGYNNLKTSEYNFIDTMHNVTNFLEINPGLNNITGKLRSSEWFEAYISYARTLFDNEVGRLNAGITVRVGKGISGAYADINSLSYTTSFQNNQTVYTATDVSAEYGYTASYDQWKSSNTSSQNIKNYMAYTNGGASIDAGIEYLIKPQGTTSFYNDENYYDYDWKFGLSVLDVGANQYVYGSESRIIYGVNPNITNTVLDNKFDSTITSLKTFNDSLATITNLSRIGGKFIVFNPMRVVANVDRYITGNFYVNAEVSVGIPLSGIKANYYQVKNINLFALTPRWETKRFGVYLPIQYNTQNQFWVGAAFKAGPLLLGFHNVANLFNKTSVQNGGGYIALIFRASKGADGQTDKRLNCPKPIW